MKLIKQEYVDKGLPRGWKPYYIYQIVVNNEVVGKVVLREGTLEERYYDGHVGYSVDKQYRAFATIQHNIKTLGIENQVHVYKLDYSKALLKLAQEQVSFHLVLLDPPYQMKIHQKILDFLVEHHMLCDQCIIVIEDLKEEAIDVKEPFVLKKQQNYGITSLQILVYKEKKS